MPTSPLCVDLDGTLVRCDTCMQSIGQLLRTKPWFLLRILYWCTQGLGVLKERVANYVLPDVAALPYNEEVIAFLHTQRKAGRTLLLVTASHQTTASLVADHVGLFADAIGSTAVRDLTSSRKRDFLVAEFGNQQYDYMGNSSADLAVWRSARTAFIVNASRWVECLARKHSNVQEWKI